MRKISGWVFNYIFIDYILASSFLVSLHRSPQSSRIWIHIQTGSCSDSCTPIPNDGNHHWQHIEINIQHCIFNYLTKWKDQNRSVYECETYRGCVTSKIVEMVIVHRYVKWNTSVYFRVTLFMNDLDGVEIFKASFLCFQVKKQEGNILWVNFKPILMA